MLEPVGDALAARPRRLGRLHRIARRIALARRPRNSRGAGSARNRGCAACRSSRPDPSSPGRNRRPRSSGVSASASAWMRRRAPGQRLRHREQPRDDPLDIGVDHHRAPAEGDRGDRGGGIGADAGQLRSSASSSGKRPPMLGRHRPGAGEQIAGAGIIAEPRPGGHHLAVVGRGQRLDRRPAPR